MTQHDILSTLEAATHEAASSLHFIPARPRVRRDGWSEARQRRFVAARGPNFSPLASRTFRTFRRTFRQAAHE